MSVFSNIYKKQYEDMEASSNQYDDNNFFAMYEIFENAMLNSFVWENLPDKVYFTRPEQQLYYRGLNCMFQDDEGELNMFPAFPNGTLREDGFYSDYTIIAPNGKTWMRKFEDIELCENMPSQLPTMYFVLYYIKQMKNTLNTIDIQMIKIRGGDVFEVSDEDGKREVAKLWDNMKKNIPISCIMNKKLNDREITKISLYDSKESNIMDLYEIYDKQKHEFLTYFGLNNVETEKKERLTTNEVDGNNDIIKHGMYESMYLCRLDFCRRCKEHFGSDILCLKNRNEEGEDKELDTIEEIVSENEELEEMNEEHEEEIKEEKAMEEEKGDGENETNEPDKD